MDRPHAILAGAGRIELAVGRAGRRSRRCRRPARRRPRGRDRPSCRTGATGRPAELLPIIPPSVARSLVETSGPNIRPSGFRCALSWSSTTPGSTRTVIRVAVDDADPVQVLREVDHDGRPDRLPREARGRPARQDRHPLLGGDPDDRDDVVGRPRHDHAQRLDLVQARVGGVQPARPAIEADLGACLSAQAIAPGGRGRGRCASSQAHMPSWRSISVGADLL